MVIVSSPSTKSSVDALKFPETEDVPLARVSIMGVDASVISDKTKNIIIMLMVVLVITEPVRCELV